MGRRGARVAALLLVAAAQLAAALPAAQCGSITVFDGGLESSQALLAAPGSVRFANISVPVQSFISGGSLALSPLALNGSLPLRPTLDIGGDGALEWMFDGTGYGAFGEQELLSDGSREKEWSFPSPGTVSSGFALPEGAEVEGAVASVEALAERSWWNTSWRSRIPLQVRELAGKNQTDFVVEVLLDTRNWSLRSAESELRVTRLDPARGMETEVPIQILDEISNGSKCFEASLLFAVSNLSASSTQTYYVYFNNTGAPGPSPLLTDFHGRLIKNRLSGQTVERSFLGLLTGPYGCTIDPWGNLWVADRILHAVIGYSGSLGTPGASGSDSSHFKAPQDVAVRRDGLIVVSDPGNFRVCVFRPDGNLVRVLGVTGTPGSDDSHFQYPSGVAVDRDNNMYVADAGLHRVQVFDPNGSLLKTLGTPGTAGTGNMEFNQPFGLFVTASRDILVADRMNHRVLALKHLGGSSWAYNYTLGTTGNPGGDSLHLNQPFDVCVDTSGSTFVADTLNMRVQKFTGTTYRSTIGVTGQTGADNLHFAYPSSVAVSTSGEVFVCDYPLGRVQVYDAGLRHVRSLGSRHWSNLLSPGGSEDQFNEPWGVASNTSGAILVSDTQNHRVQVFTPLGSLVQTLGTTGVPGSDSAHFYFPRGLAVSRDGRVFVADGGYQIFPGTYSNHRVQVYNDLSDGVADATIGVSGSPGNDMGHLNQPWDVSINADDRAAIADRGFFSNTYPIVYYGHRVQILSDLSDLIPDFTYGVPGTPGCSTTLLNGPRGVGLSPSGTTYVADTDNNRVVGFKNDNNAEADFVINAFGTPGSGTYQLRCPSDVAVDPEGGLLVTDTENHRVQVYRSTGEYIQTIGETGVSLSDAFHLNSPCGIHVSSDGKILIADTGNHRVLRISPASLTLGEPEVLRAPENLSLSVAGVEVWRRNGTVVGRFDLELAGALRFALPGLTGSPDSYGNPMAVVEVNITNLGRGTVRLASLCVRYTVSLRPPDLSRSVRDYVASHASEADGEGMVSVPLVFSAASPGGLRVGGLNLTGDFAPVLLSPVPDLELDEDTSAPGICDLSRYFRDDFDQNLSYILMSATNSSVASVGLSREGLLSVNCSVPTALNWHGWIELRARASDSRGFTATSNDFRVVVRSVNDAPEILSSPPSLSATVGSEWSYYVEAGDADGDALTLSLVTRPAGMTLDQGLRRIAWTPTEAQVGENEVVVRASDGALHDEQAFIINVTAGGPPNTPPRVLSTPVTVAEVGKTYEYRLRASDDDGDPLAFTLDRCPAGMTIDSTGLIEWVPTEADLGVHEVVARISDGKSSVTQEFNITVARNITGVLPVLRITEPSAGSRLRGRVFVRGTASASAGEIELVEVKVDDGGWKEAVGRASWAFQLNTTELSNGRHQIFARARDTEGHYAEANVTVEVDNSAPAEPSVLPGGLLLWLLAAVCAGAAAAGAAYALAAKRREPRTPAGAYYRAGPPAPLAGPPVPPSPATGAAAGQLQAMAPQFAPPPAPARAPPAPPRQRPVDSVFLIYHDGRLITYFSRVDSAALDDTLDMIRKFVKASFSGQLGRLDSMQYESQNIIMERGNMMYMVVITPLRDFDQLRREMRHLLNAIDEKYRVVFKVWDGDFTKVKGVKTMVERFAGEEVWEEERGEEAGRGAPQGAPAAPSAPQVHPPKALLMAASPAPTPLHTAPQDGHGPAPEAVAPPATPAPVAPAPLLPAEAAREGEVHMPAAGEGGAPREAAGLEPAGVSPTPPAPPSAPEAGEPAAAAPADEAVEQKPVRAESDLSREEKLRILEDRFLLGEITEETYRDMKTKLMKR
ncbi:MAG: putative Ig domain-containing protein [Thermoplasmatota archaeon]